MTTLYRLAYANPSKGKIESWYFSTEDKALIKKQEIKRVMGSDDRLAEQFFGIEKIYVDII